MIPGMLGGDPFFQHTQQVTLDVSASVVSSNIIIFFPLESIARSDKQLLLLNHGLPEGKNTAHQGNTSIYQCGNAKQTSSSSTTWLLQTTPREPDNTRDPRPTHIPRRLRHIQSPRHIRHPPRRPNRAARDEALGRASRSRRVDTAKARGTGRLLYERVRELYLGRVS